MILIGDIHGKYKEYMALISKYEATVQLGDFGWGFHPEKDKNLIIPTQHHFIRGNHDSPAVCRKVPNYLGEFGITPEGYFFISGGYSIDKYLRIEGVSWWSDEELSYQQFEQMMALYEKTKPEIVISHECPKEITKIIIQREPIQNRTSSALSEAFKRHKPRLWAFGHYHQNFNLEYQDTHFIGLDELSVAEI